MRLKGISKAFLAPVLNDLSASFDRGFHIITGRNGSGKTTLLKIMSGRLLPDKGEVSLPSQKVSSVFSSLSFYPQLKVKENLEFFFAINGLKFFEESFLKTADICGFDEKELSKKSSDLSSGNSVKAGLLKMYMEDREVFLIDEALSLLDDRSFEKNLDFLKEKAKEKTIILVSHQKERYSSKEAFFWEMTGGKITLL